MENHLSKHPKNPPLAFMPFLFWFLGTLFYFLQFLSRSGLAILSPEIMADFQIGAADFATLVSAAGLAYALAQIPAGLLIDRFGPRLIMALATAIFAIGSIIFGQSHTMNPAIIGRICMGIGSTFAFLGISKLCLMWFPSRFLGFLLGVSVFLGSLGGANAPFVVNFLAQRGWRAMVVESGIVGLILAAFIYLIVRERTETLEAKEEAQNNTPINIKDALKSVCLNKQIFLAGMWTFLLYMPISILPDAFSALAAEQMYSVPRVTANLTPFGFYMGFAVGAIIYGALASIASVKRLLALGSFLTLSTLFMLIKAPVLCSTTFYGIPLFLIFYGFMGFNLGGISLAFPIATSQLSAKVAGLVVGYVNMFCMISGPMAQKLIGYLLDKGWDGTYLSDGVTPHYSVADWEHALTFSIVGVAIGCVLTFFLASDTQEGKTSTKERNP